MKRKCTTCKEYKDPSAFSDKTSGTNGKQTECKVCAKIYNKKYRHSANGRLRDMYGHQFSSSVSRGMQGPNYSFEEFKEWAIHHGFTTLYNNWKQSGFKKDFGPSGDRIRDDRPYTLGNLRLCTFRENYMKEIRSQRTAVAQYNVKGECKGEYKDTYTAERATGIAQQNISKAVNGNLLSAGGYLWVYAGIRYRDNIIAKKIALFIKKATRQEIYKYTLEGELVDSYPTQVAAAASVEGMMDISVGQCCRGMVKSSNGYIWLREGDDTIEDRLAIIAKGMRPCSNFKEVSLYNLKGELQDTYRTTGKAHQATGVPTRTIVGCCTGHTRKNGNRLWIYTKDIASLADRLALANGPRYTKKINE